MKWVSRIFRPPDYALIDEQIGGALLSGKPPDLITLADVANISEPKLFERYQTALIGHISIQVNDGIAAGFVDSQAIYERAIGLGLTKDEATKAIRDVVSSHFTKLVAEVLEDGQVDPQEDVRLENFMRMVGASELKADTAELLNQGRRMYRAANGPLEPVEAPILLKRGEYCVYVVEAEALEDRSRTVRIGYHGPSARIRIAKGIYYNVGSITPSRQVETYQHSFGAGALCATNKRLLWVSPSKSLSIPLANIVRFDPFIDGIKIFKGTGKPLLFVWDQADRAAVVMIERAIEELRFS